MTQKAEPNIEELLAKAESDGDRFFGHFAPEAVTLGTARSERLTVAGWRAFVGPYYTSGKAILTRSKRLAAATIPQELDSPELRFTALAGSTSEAFVAQRLPQAQLLATEHLDVKLALGQIGQVDVRDLELSAVRRLQMPNGILREVTTKRSHNRPRPHPVLGT